MKPDLTPDALEELASAIDDSLACDRPALWQPAFGAADGKPKRALSQELTHQVAETQAGTTPDPSGAEPEAAPEPPGTFLALVKGWLGRA